MLTILSAVALVVMMAALHVAPPAHRKVASLLALAFTIAFATCGLLCLAGLVGPAVGNMRLQLAGVLGYAVVLPVACWMLAGWWRGAR